MFVELPNSLGCSSFKAVCEVTEGVVVDIDGFALGFGVYALNISAQELCEARLIMGKSGSVVSLEGFEDAQKYGDHHVDLCAEWMSTLNVFVQAPHGLVILFEGDTTEAERLMSYA